MKKELIFSLIFVVLGVACGGGDGARRTGQQQGYEVIGEGSAPGVTASIQGPGETLPPITGTNADTTTAFTIDPNAVGSPMPAPSSGVLAGTLPNQSPAYAGTQPSYPQPMASSSSSSSSRSATTSARPQQTPSRPSQPVRNDPPPSYEPAPQPPPPTDTAYVSQPAQPQPTQQPPQQQKPPQNQDEPEEEEEEVDPPPPTTTDTRGQ